ncbi:MAG: phage holin family protein [Opitutales bacterium]
MNFLLKLLLTALVVMGTAYLLPGVAVEDFIAALIATVVLTLLNTIVRPVLVILTIPLTILTLGLFLLVINAAMILLTAHWIDGFRVEGFWWAVGFSIVLSLLTSIVESTTGKIKKKA